MRLFNEELRHVHASYSVACKFMKQKTVTTIRIVSLQQASGNPEEMQSNFQSTS